MFAKILDDKTEICSSIFISSNNVGQIIGYFHRISGLTCVVNYVMRLLCINLILSAQFLSAQNVKSENKTALNFDNLKGSWDSEFGCSDSSMFFVNNAEYLSYFSIYVASDSVLYWNLPFDRETSCHGGSNQYEVAYFISDDTLFIEDEYLTIPDYIRASFKIELQDDTGLCLTRIRTLSSVYNYFRREIFHASSVSLHEVDSNAIQQGEFQSVCWEEQNDSLLLLYQNDTLITITNPDTSDYSIITIYHPNVTWQQPLNAIKTIPGYKHFNQFKIIGYPTVFRSGFDQYILLACNLDGIADKYNQIYLSFYLGKDLEEE